MIDKYFEWNIDGIQANTVFEGAEVTIPISKCDYKDLFINKEIIELFDSTEDIFKSIFNSNNEKLNKSIIDEFHLSYMTKENGHYIDYNYPEIFQNIFI